MKAFEEENLDYNDDYIEEFLLEECYYCGKKIKDDIYECSFCNKVFCSICSNSYNQSGVKCINCEIENCSFIN